MMTLFKALVAVVLVAAQVAPANAARVGPAASTFALASSDIAQGGEIPAAQIYPRCGGQNISPGLSWTGAPKAARSFVLTMIDTDVKPSGWSHWVVADIPAAITAIPRNARTLPAAARQLVSNFGDAAYAGPCPPTGTGTHHYEFTIWAMPATAFPIAADANALALRASLQKASLAHASLVGWVRR